MNEDLNGCKPTYMVSFAEMITFVRSKQYSYSYENGRKYWAFIHVIEGKMEYSLLEDRKVISTSAGQTICIPAGTKYISTYKAPDTRVAVLHFGLEPDLLTGMKPCLLPSDASRFFRGAKAFDRYQNMSAAFGLLGLLFRDDQAMPAKYRRIQPGVKAIEEDPVTAHSVDYYAALCKMSIPGFRRSFKEYTGRSPVEYRNDLRLDLARRLIVGGEFSVEAAAHESGFTNLSFFYRLFRRKYGVKPGSI